MTFLITWLVPQVSCPRNILKKNPAEVWKFIKSNRTKHSGINSERKLNNPIRWRKPIKPNYSTKRKWRMNREYWRMLRDHSQRIRWVMNLWRLKLKCELARNGLINQRVMFYWIRSGGDVLNVFTPSDRKCEFYKFETGTDSRVWSLNRGKVKRINGGV